MSKTSLRLLAAWLALHEGCALFGVHDTRAAAGVSVVGLAAAFFVFMDATSYRSVRPKKGA